MDLSFAQNQIKAARALKVLEAKKKAGLIGDFTQDDVIAEYQSYHGIVITPEVVADQEKRADSIGRRKKK